MVYTKAWKAVISQASQQKESFGTAPANLQSNNMQSKPILNQH